MSYTNIKKYVIILLVIYTLSCSKERVGSPPSPPPTGINYIDIKWSVDITRSPLLTSLSFAPILYKDKVIINSEWPDMSYPDNAVLFIDTTSKTISDYWFEFINGPRLYDKYQMAKKGNLLMLGAQGSVDCINLDNSSSQWNANVYFGFVGIYQHDNEVYKGADNGVSWSKIMSTDIVTGNWEDIYQFHKDDNYIPNFVGIEKAIRWNGDELLIWKNLGWTSSRDRMELFCYSLTHDSLMWRSQKYEGFSGVVPPIAVGDKVYAMHDKTMHAFDLMTGQELWVFDMTKNSQCPSKANGSTGAMHINGDRIIAVTDRCAEVLVINRQNGTLIKRWTRDPELDWSHIEGEFTHVDGKLFYASNRRLEVLDDYSGEPLLDWRRTLHLGELYNGVAVDSVTESIYVHNGKKLFCLRIPADLRS